MNFIDELLKDEKVEWKTIGDIIERYSEKAQYNKDIKIVYTISKDYGIIIRYIVKIHGITMSLEKICLHIIQQD